MRGRCFVLGLSILPAGLVLAHVLWGMDSVAEASHGQPPPARGAHQQAAQVLGAGSSGGPDAAASGGATRGGAPGPPLHIHDHEVNRKVHVGEAAWEAGLQRVPGNRGGARRFLRRLRANRTVRIVLFGGSIVKGWGCCHQTCTQEQQDDCAWGGRLRERLQQAAPGAHVVVQSRARRGFTSRSFLPEVSAWLRSLQEAPDVVIWDFVVNDRMDGSGSYPERASDAATAVETVVRWVRALLPRTQLILGAMVPNRDGETNRSYMQEMLVDVARHYDIPLVSFLDVVEAHVQAGGKLKDVWIPGMNMVHPARRAHEGFADVICRLFNAELDALDSGGPAAAAADDLEPPVARRDFDDPDPLPWLHKASSDVPHSCMPVTRHVPDAPTKATPRRSRRGTWQLAEDSPGKPGWIAQGSPTARSPKQDDWLEFPVAFGSRPVLTVQFVKSYSGMGDAEVRLLEKAYTLRGYWESSSSQAFTVYFNASAPHSAEPIGEVSYVRHGFGVPPNSEGTLQVRLVAGAKFKLLGVFTC